MKGIKKYSQGFTLLELLVVVLIIGILAGIALPQYRLIVEKTRMTEAITILQIISQAQDRFYLINDKYANAYEIDKLDIEIPGQINISSDLWNKRIKTQFFMYSPDGDNGTMDTPRPDGRKAVAHRLPYVKYYYLYINKKNKLTCYLYSGATDAQKKLCNKINQDGYL